MPTITVYLAEDHIAIRELLANYLQALPGYAVVGQSGDGRVAAEAVEALKPAVLVADLGLPGMDGIRLMREVAKTSPTTQMLVFTSHCDAVTVRQAFEAGARGMVEKSSPLSKLKEALETVAVGKPYFSDMVGRQLQLSMGQPAKSPDGLTLREREILQLVAEGLSNKEVSQRLGISLKTAENHRHNLMTKLRARNASDLTREAFRLGLMRLEVAPWL
jgi:DNA-binding NarL/FixJ family response regulator